MMCNTEHRNTSSQEAWASVVFDRLAWSTHTVLDLVLVFVVRVRSGEHGAHTKQRSMTPSRARVRKHAGIFCGACVMCCVALGEGAAEANTKKAKLSFSKLHHVRRAQLIPSQLE
jgi:hypothetical protein